MIFNPFLMSHVLSYSVVINNTQSSSYFPNPLSNRMGPPQLSGYTPNAQDSSDVYVPNAGPSMMGSSNIQNQQLSAQYGVGGMGRVGGVGGSLSTNQQQPVYSSNVTNANPNVMSSMYTKTANPNAIPNQHQFSATHMAQQQQQSQPMQQMQYQSSQTMSKQLLPNQAAMGMTKHNPDNISSLSSQYSSGTAGRSGGRYGPGSSATGPNPSGGRGINRDTKYSTYTSRASRSRSHSPPISRNNTATYAPSGRTVVAGRGRGREDIKTSSTGIGGGTSSNNISSRRVVSRNSRSRHVSVTY